jgi:hypothetical protein
MSAIWRWVDEVVSSQPDRCVNTDIALLIMDLWHGKGTKKRDKLVKRIQRGNSNDLYALIDLALGVVAAEQTAAGPALAMKNT